MLPSEARPLIHLANCAALQALWQPATTHIA